ncbi:MAG: hypothetical protein E6Q69_17015 [Aquipseudomonas alcaligenes]|uniref:Transposase IS30-like HTH domain-containing protein n=1 Tax=Aquipseudomonas alcaligenes TaxID=43263 RepID=A0A5C7VSB3_AQUAC|nr:MAG: hypothetical protein E6Q69_17015 [Pseudomonas alcaligenes]
MARMYVGISEAGCRCGEDHPRAKLSDTDIELIFALRAEGLPYSLIAQKMDCAKSTVADVLKYRRRVARPVRWKRVPGQEQPR